MWLAPMRNMSATLHWLGGTDVDRRTRALLIGQWQDRRGSVYTLTPGRSESSIAVLTVRPDGRQLFTMDLIVCRESSAFWGTMAQRQFVGSVEETQATWRRDGTSFHWRKLQ